MRYERDARRRLSLKDKQDLGNTPLADLPLAPGSYLLTLTAPGRSEVHYPFLITRGTSQALDLFLPESRDVPPGFVYIPEGTFMLGSSSEEAVRQSFLATVPIHPVKTAAYLIARNETTYGEWLEYLNSLPADERAQLLIAPKGALAGSVSLKQLPDGVWEISLQAGGKVLTAKAGEPLVYSARPVRKQQNWLRMPVGSVSFEQAKKYAAWLSKGRVPGARLCDELEWERAARGADDREWPHGDELTAKDANFDETYDKNPMAMGPDEVGSYPESRSPFGVDDLAGNVFEWTYSRLSKEESILRGGSYWYAALVERSTNRQSVDPNFRDPTVGFRICINAPPTKDKY
jgi:formylglycine-generating enzyme required for sulfatase activity